MLAAYEEEGLTFKERTAIEIHLAQCQDCRELLALIIRTKPAIPPGFSET
jgi:hypothetical protein